jgi:ATP-dependent Clp protease ATP-binding subunit ClpA
MSDDENQSRKVDLSRVQPLMETLHQLVEQYQHEYVTLEHLLAVLLQQDEVQGTIHAVGGDPKELSKDIFAHIESGAMPQAIEAIFVARRTLALTRVLDRAVTHTVFSDRGILRPVDLLISILEEDASESHAAYFLAKHGVDPTEVKRHVSHSGDFDEDEDEDDGSITVTTEADGKDGKPRRSRADITLGKYCENLNELALKGKIDPLIGRETEVHSLMLTTARRTKNNVVLVGEPGVGKTAVVEGLAKMIAEENVPDALKGSIVYSLSVGDLLAGTKFRGDMEERVKQVLEAIEAKGEELGITPILFIDEVHTLMGAGSGNQGGLDVANLLKPALAKGKLRCIGGTTYEEFRKHFEKDRAMMRRFQKLDILEPSVEDAKRILAGLAPSYADFHAITYTPDALDAAVELTARYVTDRFLPDKAIDVIDAAGARQKLAKPDERITLITRELVENEVSRIAKIPPQTVKEDESEKLASLEADLQAVVFGQDDAITAVNDAVLMSRAGLRDLTKPQGNYLFAGPTGVGKTELAKQLASTLGITLERFDMSEYMEKHSVSKFIGSPPGYVGFGDGAAGSGLLINAIEKAPHCVLLIDEIEKAHPDIFNVFLQIMDNGQLTSSAGKTVSFRNVILIMTTNAGAAELQKNTLGFGSNSTAGSDDKVIERMFAPEFRNRLDAIVKFNSLTRDNMIKVVEKFLKQLTSQCLDRGVVLNITDAAKQWLAEKGYDPKMGARPLARVIQNNVSKQLSKSMLFGELKDGGEALVDVEGEGLSVTKVQPEPLLIAQKESE